MYCTVTVSGERNTTFPFHLALPQNRYLEFRYTLHRGFVLIWRVSSLCQAFFIIISGGLTRQPPFFVFDSITLIVTLAIQSVMS